jgi:hypothetical protein
MTRPSSLVRLLRITSVSIAFTAAVSLLSLLPVRSVQAQERAHGHSAVRNDSAGTLDEKWLSNIERRLDQQDAHLINTDKNVADNSYAIARIIGIGIGAMGVLGGLEIYQLKLRPKGTVHIGDYNE